MKKVLYFVAVLSAFMTSCNSENEIIDSKPTKVTSTITATFDQPATRVQMGTSNGTNTPLQWNAGDQIAVYNKTSGTFGKYAAASTVADGDLLASFNFVEQAGTSEIVPEEAHLAAYPYARIAASTFEFRYQTTQTYTENSFDRLAMPMVASNASGTEFSFKAQAAVLRLKVSTTASDVTVSSIDITSASNALTGYATPNMGEGTYGVPTASTGHKVTLNCATPVAISSTATEFNIVVPGQTYPSGDLTIIVRTNKGRIVKTSKTDATFAAGKVYNLTISDTPVPNTPEDGVLTFTSTGGLGVSMYVSGLQYQTTNQEWTPFNGGVVIGAGDFIQFKAAEGAMHNTINNTFSFTSTDDIVASGSVMSLLPAGTDMGTSAFRRLFKNCYRLVTAPELPATTLAATCYQEMFYGCTALQTAPELPATTLANSCYVQMFYGCTSLQVAPNLPAPTLVTACYSGMFYGCSSLREVHASFSTWGSQTKNWLRDVATGGTFYCSDACQTALGSKTRGVDTVPSDWTVVTE